MKENYRTIDKSELEDFDTECRACGLDPQEFRLSEHDVVETSLDNGLFITNGKISITRNDTTRTYCTGNATHWVTDFSDELRKGIFH
jgi:hypothetical protein